ncbi:MAG TPA: hypothetical protein VNH64_12285, partial [Parvularculaceae bacterium]|nr:hypothetical protein [Parvularculaceae bacterium]
MRVFSCVLIVALAIAEPAGAETLRAGPSVKIEGGSDNVFAAGADVEISGDVASTSGKRAMVAAAGGSVTVSADVDGDVAIAGGDVSFSGRTDHLFAAGGNVAVSGRADDRAAIAGGRITVEPTAIFANDVKIAGASVDFGGQAQKGAKLAGGFVRLAGAVEGDAELAGESIEVGPQAHVSGDLVIEAPDKPDIPSSAVIGGEVIYKKTSVHDIEWKRWDHHPFGSPHSVREGIFGALFGFVVLSASGIVMMLLFPNWLGAAAAAGRDKP